MPDTSASAKVAFLHPLKKQFRKTPYISNDRPLSRDYITTFASCVSHQTGEVFTFKIIIKIIIPIGKISSLQEILKIL